MSLSRSQPRPTPSSPAPSVEYGLGLPGSPGSFDSPPLDPSEPCDLSPQRHAFPDRGRQAAQTIDARMACDLERLQGGHRTGFRHQPGRGVLYLGADTVDPGEHREPRRAVTIGAPVPLVPHHRPGDVERLPAGQTSPPPQVEVLEVHEVTAVEIRSEEHTSE